MKKLLLAATILGSFAAYAADPVPYYFVDVDDVNADKCVITVDALAPVTVDVVVDNVNGVAASGFRVCRYNINALSAGTHTVKTVARNSFWGVDAPVVVFDYTKPTTIQAPTSPRLAKF